MNAAIEPEERTETTTDPLDIALRIVVARLLEEEKHRSDFASRVPIWLVAYVTLTCLVVAVLFGMNVFYMKKIEAMIDEIPERSGEVVRRVNEEQLEEVRTRKLETLEEAMRLTLEEKD